MSSPNGADALVRMLQLNGVKHIFGLCGDTSLPFYDALARLDHGMTTCSRATSAAPPTWPTAMRA
jgi:thiamine pyrophosphate-dependent acetolactate synthase large subunit-like protein